MNEVNRWMLPDGLEEALPSSARRLESLRRKILDQFDTWGYDLVMPPLAEYLESLLTGTGRELDLQTFKLIDQNSGRLMGIRADLTPQVARIDAHRLRSTAVNRLCYVGTVLRTRADEWSGSRSPLQAGAELFGHDGIDSDVEIIGLMLETLRLCGISEPSIDLGHVAIFRSLAAAAGLTPAQEREIFACLQRKALPDIAALLGGWNLSPVWSETLRRLADLNGGPEVIALARSELQNVPGAARVALDHLDQVIERLLRVYPALDIHVDLAELRGYSYHTGLVFAAFVPGSGQEIARGGRYNGIGQAFGAARAATGFSTDLKYLLRLPTDSTDAEARPTEVWAPDAVDSELETAIAELRAQGVRVRRILAGEAVDPNKQIRRLERRGATWVVEGA